MIFDNIKSIFNKNKFIEVYCFAYECEINKFLNGDKFSFVGCVNGVSEIKFFSNLNNAKDVWYNYQTNKTYLCKFLIDSKIARQGHIISSYPPHGYKCDETLIDEFLIPVKNYKKEWFKGATTVKNFFKFQDKQRRLRNQMLLDIH